MSLLEQVKAVHMQATNSGPVSDEQLEVAFAWVTGEVGLIQVAKALDMPRSQARQRLSGWVVSGIQRGKFALTKGKDDDKESAE